MVSVLNQGGLNMSVIDAKQELPMKMTVQIAIMTGPENRWYTGEEMGHNPTNDEATFRFILKGEATNFAEWWKGLTWQQKFQEYWKAIMFLTERGERFPQSV